MTAAQSAAFLALIPDFVRDRLPAYLPQHRWFGDKARSISGVSLATLLPIDGLPFPTALAVIEVAFTGGAPARYVVSLSLVDGNEPATGVIAAVEVNGRPGWVVDGLVRPEVRGWLLSLFLQRGDIPVPGGTLDVDTLPTGSATLSGLVDAPNRVLGVDQSNTAIVYGFVALVKVFRRLQPGTNPDVELTRFLTARTSFTRIPAYFGSLSFVPEHGEPIVLAVAQQFVESTGNGWEFVLGTLAAAIDQADAADLEANARTIGRQLGGLTAEMHLALASDPWTAAVAPEAIRAVDVSRWRDDYVAMLDRIVRDVREAMGRLDAESRELAVAFLAIADGLRDRAHGFDRLIGRAKTRVHGDYHLGQTLRTMDDDFVVLDFEGEPQRPMEERRRKTSPLKDVAGMLRSFGYARGTAARRLSADSRLLPSDLVAWERTVRTAFLETYEGKVRSVGGSFLPVSAADTRAALSSWELDKAAYEVLYELNNRPDWLWIPLSAMIKHGQPSE